MKTTALRMNKDLSLKEMIDDLIMASRIEGKSERTIDQYKRVLLPFAKFMVFMVTVTVHSKGT